MSVPPPGIVSSSAAPATPAPSTTNRYVELLREVVDVPRVGAALKHDHRAGRIRLDVVWIQSMNVGQVLGRLQNLRRALACRRPLPETRRQRIWRELDDNARAAGVTWLDHARAGKLEGQSQPGRRQWDRADRSRSLAASDPRRRGRLCPTALTRGRVADVGW